MARTFSPQLVQKAREAKPLTREELAQAVAANVTTIWRIERGDSTPSAHLLGRLADALGVSTEAFYEVTG